MYCSLDEAFQNSFQKIPDPEPQFAPRNHCQEYKMHLANCNDCMNEIIREFSLYEKSNENYRDDSRETLMLIMVSVMFLWVLTRT